jgi:CHAD domain-containing protein
MLELLQDFYGPELKKQLASIRHLQDRLGEISDCSTSLKLLRDYSGVNPSAEAQLKRHLDRKLNESLTSFMQYWRQELNDPSQEAQWVRYLCGRQR